MTPEEYFSGLIQSGTEYHEAMKATQMYFPHWSPAPSQPYGATAPLPVTYQQAQQPGQSYIQHSAPVTQQYQQPIQYIAKAPEKTFYAPLITLGLILLLMFTPFLTFQHDELSNSEEEDVCEGFYYAIQAGASGDELDFDDINTKCPMNGFSSTFYSIDTVANIDTDAFTDDSAESTSEPQDDEDIESEEAMFVVALVMLLSAPIIYLILSIIALASVGLKKYPTAIGVLQLIYVVAFLIISSIGYIDFGSEELTVGGNFAGIGMYLIGFASIGYFIRK